MSEELQDNVILLKDSILTDFLYEPLVEKELVVFHTSDIRLERVPRIYTEYEVLPAFIRMTDDNGQLVEFTREQREWEMVLPFFSGNDTPRKQPTDLIYKGRKMKNKFPIPVTTSQLED